jgi:hypothetical protein
MTEREFQVHLLQLQLQAQDRQNQFRSSTTANNAFGVRFSSGTLLGGDRTYINDAVLLLGGECFYQRMHSQLGRSEYNFSLYFNSNSYSNVSYLTTYIGMLYAYQWTPSLGEGINLYLGPGFGFQHYHNSFKLGDSRISNNVFQGVVGGQIGLDFRLGHNSPMFMSIDFRPNFIFDDEFTSWNLKGGISFKYGF